MSAKPILSFQEWLSDLEAQAGQMGLAMDKLPRSPQQIYMLECAGYVVDMETGDIVAMAEDRISLSPAGQAWAIIDGTGFLDEGGATR